MHESCQKDVECCFGVLQAWWSMITHPYMLWNAFDIAGVIYTWIIMHKIILEDKWANT